MQAGTSSDFAMEFMNFIKSHVCCGYLVPGAMIQPPPPEMLTYLPPLSDGMSAKPTTLLRSGMAVELQTDFCGQMTERHM